MAQVLGKYTMIEYLGPYKLTVLLGVWVQGKRMEAGAFLCVWVLGFAFWVSGLRRMKV